MKIDLRRRYDSSDDFFILGGSVVMKVSAYAAIAICERAAQHGLVIARIEGGIWHAPEFEARLDCIWDGLNPPMDRETAGRYNRDAAEFIQVEQTVHDVFVITAPLIKER
jgi:Colicin-E5 Imm protein